jgi:hypothetical protein
MFCDKFHAVTKRSQMHPNTTRRTETLVLGPMGWIGSVCCEKSRRDFMARTFALITLVHRILHRVSCSYETMPNAPKHYETHQNMILGSNGVIRCVRCKKLQRDFVARTFKFIAPVQNVLQQVSCSYETIADATKCYETDWKTSLGSNGVDWLCLLRKIPTWLRGTNSGITCSSLPRFAPSFKQLRNDPKCTQTLWNTPKHEIRVQWGGWGAFDAKNYNVTSWHELLN